MINTVIKRDGTEEAFSHEKLNKLAKWTSAVVTDQESNVDWSHIALDAMKKLHNKCTTEDIVKSLIQVCLDEQTEGYLYAAGKLLASSLHKDVHKSDIPPSLYDYIENMIDRNLYRDLLEDYTEEEVNILNEALDHSKDFRMTHSQINQAMDKYLLKNKETLEIFETPQFMCMRIAMDIASKRENKLEDALELYEIFSNFDINLPTPMWATLGSPRQAGTSCLLYKVEDSLGSINAGDNIAYMMTTDGAGIGSVMFTRSPGMSVDNGRLKHSGKIPYFRYLEAGIQAAVQGERGGAATTYINVLDPQIEDLISLKNPMSIPELKILGIDFAFSFNAFFLDKAKKNQDWMLIDYSLSKDLYESMYAKDQEEFEVLYNWYLNNDAIPKKIINAKELLASVVEESHVTGRLYEFNATNANIHTAYKDPIYSSNLCNEIYLPTKAFKHRSELDKNQYDEGDGWVQTCNLAAINLSRNYSDEEYERLAYWCLTIIDHVINTTKYSLPQIGVTTKLWKSAGVSVINMAYHLARNGFNYTSVESKKHVHELFERHEYMLLKASLAISKETGLAPWIHKTKYPEGYLPIDDYNKNVDSIADFEYKYDWESLRSEIITNGGIAHTALSCAVPSESSAILSNSTNGLYPVRGNVTIKTGINSKNVTIPPQFESLDYQIFYDVPTLDMIHFYAIAQKFLSQGPSADFTFDLTQERDRNTKHLMNMFLARNHFGMKGKYYSVFKTQDEEATSYMEGNSKKAFQPTFIAPIYEDPGCGGGSCTL